MSVPRCVVRLLLPIALTASTAAAPPFLATELKKSSKADRVGASNPSFWTLPNVSTISCGQLDSITNSQIHGT